MTDYWDDVEAIENERFEADVEQREMEIVGNRFAAARRAGRCMHASSVSYIPGKTYYPEQHGLKPGQIACTEHTAGCNAVWNSDTEWQAAMDAAL